MPVVQPADDTATGMFFDFSSMSFVEAAPEPDLPELPEKVTQEEMKFMRIVAGYIDEWKIVRAAPRSYRLLSEADRRRMQTLYDSLQTAENVAALFMPKKRLKTLMDFANKHPAAVIYLCNKKGIR